MNNNKTSSGLQMLFFDINETVLNIAPLKSFINGSFNENIYELWFSKLLHYSLVSTVTGTFKDFLLLATDAINSVSVSKGFPINNSISEILCNILSSLPAYPDVENTLTQLKKKGFLLIALSNSSNRLLEKQLTNANINHLFDKKISVEDLGFYKPHTMVYNKAAELLDVSPQSCMLIASHDWDIYGALCAGWKTAFIQRSQYSQYILSEKPDWEIAELRVLTEILSINKDE